MAKVVILMNRLKRISFVVESERSRVRQGFVSIFGYFQKTIVKRHRLRRDIFGKNARLRLKQNQY